MAVAVEAVVVVELVLWPGAQRWQRAPLGLVSLWMWLEPQWY